MPFWLVTRSHHEEVVDQLNRRLDEGASRIALLERALHRIHDSGFVGQFGIQIYDSLPVSESAPEQTEETPDPLMTAHNEDAARLRSLARTNPSKLGPALAAAKFHDLRRRAAAANPAVARFAAAETEALAR